MSSYTDLSSMNPGAQGFTSVVILAIVFVTGFLGEMLFGAATDKTLRFRTLLDYTASSEETNVVIRQNPKYADAIPIGLSVNERTGIEFAYSFFLYVLPSTFSSQDAVLKHVFHKGYPIPWPLMGPGVFLMGHTNTMRVFMNTSKNPYTYTDITNIPVQKWFHVVLNCFKGGLDIYINGTLANRISFRDTVPYQNYQDLIFFSQTNHSFSATNIACMPDGEVANIQGSFSGFLSSMKYARYALSMVEITKLMGEGPSTKRKSSSQSLPPYLADSWWTEQRAA